MRPGLFQVALFAVERLDNDEKDGVTTDTLAATFRQGAKVEPAITRILLAMARLAQIHTTGNLPFALRRAA